MHAYSPPFCSFMFCCVFCRLKSLFVFDCGAKMNGDMVVAEKWRCVANLLQIYVILTNISLCVIDMHKILLCMLSPLPFVCSFFAVCITV